MFMSTLTGRKSSSSSSMSSSMHGLDVLVCLPFGFGGTVGLGGFVAFSFGFGFSDGGGGAAGFDGFFFLGGGFGLSLTRSGELCHTTIRLVH